MEMPQITKSVCPKCSGSDFWQTQDNRLKCKKCRHLFKYKTNPFNVPDQTLNEVITEFLLGHSTNIILQRIDVSKYKLLKALTSLRILMTNDIPDIFKKIIRVGNHKDIETEKSINSINNIKHPAIGRETRHISSRALVIGILCRDGMVFAKILPNIKNEDLKFFLKNRKEKRFINCSENWQKDMALVFRNSLYRLSVKEGEKRRIDSMEAFWGYLKRELIAKGGIRKEKFFLYLGEHAWKYNHRKSSLEEQEKILSNLIKRNFS